METYRQTRPRNRIGRSIVAELGCISWNASHTISLKLRSYLRRRKRKMRGRNVLPRRHNVCRNVTSSWKALLFRGDFRGELPGNCATKMQLDAPAGRPELALPPIVSRASTLLRQFYCAELIKRNKITRMTRLAGLANGIYRCAKYLLFTITPTRALLLIATRNGEHSLIVVDCPLGNTLPLLRKGGLSKTSSSVYYR